MTEITINFTYIFAVIYAAFKVVSSVWICKREFQYPIWDQEGVQIPRGIHHKIQSFLRNWAINPEWGALKLIVFVPVFLFTGKRFIHSFMPWRVQKTPPFCKKCNDKGQYKEFFKNGPKDNGWRHCNCKDKISQEVQSEISLSTCSCNVCLDQRTIGNGRSCPHCDRRGLLVAHAKMELKRVREDITCQGCGRERNIDDVKLVDGLWFCKKCLIFSPNKLIHSLRYLKTPCFCGDPNYITYHPGWRDKDWLKKKQPTELHVGETIVVSKIWSGHQNQYLMGNPLCILGLNLPFATVEYGGITGLTGRQINVINLQGMTLHGQRDSSPIKSKEAYQPLLDPTSLRAGDKFVLMQIFEGGTDRSWTGHAFRCTKPAYTLKTRDRFIEAGTTVVECEHLSFYKFAGLSRMLFSCEGLRIIPVNDQYVKATNTHCSDIGFA